jgi:hypothetical protein
MLKNEYNALKQWKKSIIFISRYKLFTDNYHFAQKGWQLVTKNTYGFTKTT